MKVPVVDTSRTRLTAARIAEAAGVSVATVSRVINGRSGVSESAAAAVNAAIGQLNYTPKTRARRATPLRHGRIGFVTIGYHGEGWRELPVLMDTLAGATREAGNHDLSFQVEGLREGQTQSLVLNDRAVDGAILLAAHMISDEQIRAFATTVPIVRVMGWPRGPQPFDLIAFSNVEVGSIAFRYLSQEGCRNFAFLTDQPGRDFTRARVYAFADAAGAGGFPIRHFVAGHDETYDRIFGGRITWETDRQKLLDMLLESMDSPIGIFIPTDWEAVTFCQLLARRGLRVGRDIHVCSCDNEKFRLSALEFPPATIDVRAFDVGRLAVKRLLTRIEDPTSPPLIMDLQPTLVRPDR